MKNSIRSRRRNRKKQKAKATPFILLGADMPSIGKFILASLAEMQRTYERFLERERSQRIISFGHAVFRQDLRGERSQPNFRSAQDLVSWNVGNFAEVKKKDLGDPTCKFNARSPYLQCAINPTGDCSECEHREQLTSLEKLHRHGVSLRDTGMLRERAQQRAQEILEEMRSPAKMSITFQGLDYICEDGTEVFTLRSPDQ